MYVKDPSALSETVPFCGAWIKVAKNGQHGGLIAKMDEKNAYRGWDLFLQDTGLGVHIVDKWGTHAIKVSTRNAVVKPGQWQHFFVTYDGRGKAKGINLFVDGVAEKMIANVDTLLPTSSIRTPTPLRLGQRSDVQSTPGTTMQDLRLYSRLVKPVEVKRIYEVGPLQGILAATQGNRTPAQKEALYSHYLSTRDAEFKKHHRQVQFL